MTIDRISALSKLLPGVANSIHTDWKAGYASNPKNHEDGDIDGPLNPRFKDIKPKFFESFVLNNQHLLASGKMKVVIDIAGLDNSQLDPGNAGENTASAEGAIKATLDAVLSGRNLDSAEVVESISTIIHDEWMTRNGSWAPAHQMVPFDQLSEGEKEKDRVIARHAISAVKEFVSAQPATA